MQRNQNQQNNNNNNAVNPILIPMYFMTGVMAGMQLRIGIQHPGARYLLIPAVGRLALRRNRFYEVVPVGLGATIGFVGMSAYLTMTQQQSPVTDSMLCDAQGTCVQNHCLAEDFLDHTVCKM